MERRRRISVSTYDCLSCRLSRPPAVICAKPASRQRKLRLSRELAEKNIRLSRRENCGLSTKNPLLKFQHPQVNRQSPQNDLPFLVDAVMFSLCLCIDLKRMTAPLQ